MKNLKYSNIVLINLIIASIVPFLILGPFFPDLIVSVSSLFFLYYVFKNKKFYFFYKKPLIIFFIFCIYCILLSLFVAENNMLSFESSLFYFRIGVFSCFIWYLIDRDKSILIYFYYALIICFSALIIDGYFQYFTGENLLKLKMTGRVSSFFGDEWIMGSYLSRLFPLLFALFLVKEKKTRFEIYFIGSLFILVDILIFMSGERSAFFFLNLSTIFIIILIKDYQKFRLVTFLIGLMGVFILSFHSPDLSIRMFKGPAQDMGFIESPNKATIFTPFHDSLIRTGYNAFKDKPILGHGPKMFRVLCKNEKYRTGIQPCAMHPHNFYLQLLVETGVVGFLFLFTILSNFIFIVLRQFKSIIFKQKRPLTDYQVCLLAGVLISIWPLAPNGNFFNNWLMIVYSLPIGFYLQSIYSTKMVKKNL
jgi:O-antigen ligase